MILGEFDEILEEIRRTGSVTPSCAPMSLQSKCIRIIKDDEGNERQYVDEDMQERIEAKLISSIINKFKPE